MKRTMGFTLIELLVVIAIIAILAAILFPVFAQARAKARQISCLSNMKQIGLGFMMYVQDYDETAPFRRVTANGGDWWTPRMTSWKDAILPYIKNGGRDYNGGVAYASAGSGGIFQCPDNTAAWATTIPWGFGGTGKPGDEATRFPRSYAINNDAGLNNGSKFWPCVGDGGCGNGALASIDAPANIGMVAESRVTFSDVSAEFVGYECTQDGLPSGGTGFSCVKGHSGGMTQFAFFDGHAKAIKGPASISSDVWNCFGPNSPYVNDGWRNQGAQLQRANAVREWK